MKFHKTLFTLKMPKSDVYTAEVFYAMASGGLYSSIYISIITECLNEPSQHGWFIWLKLAFEI